MNTIYKVQVGAFKEKSNAEKLKATVQKYKIPAVIVNVNDLYKVQVGAFSILPNAEKRLKELRRLGFDAILVFSESVSTGGQKIYDIMKPFVDSPTAHKDFIVAYNKFMDEYNKKHNTKHSKIDKSDAWCSEFVNWAFYKAGYLDLIGYAKSAKQLKANAEKLGTWHNGSMGIRLGDIVIYQDSKGEPNHTEFAIDSKYNISGNYKGGVHVRKRARKTLKGYIRPKY